MKGKKPRVRFVSIERVHPNPWNPNKMSKSTFKTLKLNIQESLEDGELIGPIPVRKYPNRKGHYQIIDGEHRWRALQDLKQDRIYVHVMQAKLKAQAMMYTHNFNYLKGERDPKRFSEMLYDMNHNEGVSLKEIIRLLPESEEEIIDIMEAVNSETSADVAHALAREDKEVVKHIDHDKETWVELRFIVALGQAKVIENELNRIENKLRGRNRRGRALEYMAVLSGQSPIELPEPKPKKKKKRHIA